MSFVPFEASAALSPNHGPYTGSKFNRIIHYRISSYKRATPNVTRQVQKISYRCVERSNLSPQLKFQPLGFFGEEAQYRKIDVI